MFDLFLIKDVFEDTNMIIKTTNPTSIYLDWTGQQVRWG